MAVMASPFQFRCRALGEEILDRAYADRPRPWNLAWWEEQATRVATQDPHLRVQLFRFMEVLPALTNNTQIARHLKEYLDDPRLELPWAMRLATSYSQPSSGWAQWMARCTRRAAFTMARRFITGLSESEAAQAVTAFRRRRMAFSLDVLGETTHSEAQADRNLATYHHLLETVSPTARTWSPEPILDESANGLMPRVNLSIKLSALDPRFDPIDPDRTQERISARLRPLFRRARELGAFVNVDMESYAVRDLTTAIFTSLLDENEFRDWADVGIVVQAYLTDSEAHVRALLDWLKKRGTGIAVRLVKGAYWDYETTFALQQGWPIPVWTQKWQSDAHFERLARLLLDHPRWLRPAFASHNVRSLAAVMAYAELQGLSEKHYEIQMLHGMGDPLKGAIVEMGRCLRIYAPIGDLVPGMAYLIRRLLENSSNDSFLRQSFSERAPYDLLLADPSIARPPSVELPRRHYVNTFEESPMSTFHHTPNTRFGASENRDTLRRALAYVRGEFGRILPLIIGGERVDTEQRIDSINPSCPNEVVARASVATTAHVDLAVAAANHAFPEWRDRSGDERASMLHRLAEAMLDRRVELAAWLILEAGKPWREADAEVSEAIDYCAFYAGVIEALDHRPRRRDRPGENNVLVYEPRGVCAVISTWSFPLALLANMSTAALAAGNTVVIKPSVRTPAITARFVEMLSQAGIPAGVVNLVMGPGEPVGRHLVEHGDVHTIAFTGSCNIGLSILERAAVVRPQQRHLKHVIPHMGGKNAVIVDSDADLEEAAAGIVESAFACAGQKCSACSLAIVVGEVHDEFCRRLVEITRNIRVGPAEDAGTFVGPMVDRRAAESVRGFIEAGRREGRVIYEMDPGSMPGGGAYIGPTIIADLSPRSTPAQEEIFGPVLVVLRAADFQNALDIANSARYALTGGVYSRSPVHLATARREFRVGNLYINRKITGSRVDVQPWGGTKLSGYGPKAGAEDYLLRFCDPRTLCENTLRQGFAPSKPAQTSDQAKQPHG